MHLHELIVQRRVGNRREVKNGVELFVAKLFPPIERRQVLRNEIAAIAGQVFEIAGAEIIDHSQACVREFFLQRQREVRADKACAAGYEKIAG